MTDIRTELATLIASRICHDLISPVGAIGNGLELVALSGGMSQGPEMQLITESCENANARIRFFRVAYGAASETSQISAGEVQSILRGLMKNSRLDVVWDTSADLSRARVQLAFLGLQCMETAMRRGGTLTISFPDDGIKLTAQAEQVSLDPALWHHLEASPSSHKPVLGSGSGVEPAHVQFVLLPLLAADRGYKLFTQRSETEVSIVM